MASHRARGGNRRRGRPKKPKQIKRQRRRRADANGCAKRAKRRAPDRANGHGHGCAVVNGIAKPKRCVHCRKRRYWRRRGLCWACYGDPIIRGRHFDPEHTRLARSPDMRDALDLLAGVDVPAERAAPCPGPLPGFGGDPARLLALGMRADGKAELFPPLPRLPLAGVARLFGVRVHTASTHRRRAHSSADERNQGSTGGEW